MRTIDSLAVGWVDTSIEALLRNAPDILARYSHVLVTSLDSTTDLPHAATARAIVQSCPSCGFLDRGLIMPVAEMPVVAEKFDPFNGFDEMWFFADRPMEDKPTGLSIVGPLNLGSDPLPLLLGAWMKKSRCQLGLGDGIGMNYVTPEPAAARLLESWVDSQRQSPVR